MLSHNTGLIAMSLGTRAGFRDLIKENLISIDDRDQLNIQTRYYTTLNQLQIISKVRHADKQQLQRE